MIDPSVLNGPIPGMSLTTEPGNRPWENPPQIVNVEDAIEYYTDRLTESERIEYLLEALSLGVSVEAITDALTTSSVMNGVHTLDVSVLVSPVLYELIKYIAEAHEVEYVESYEELSKKRSKIPKYEISKLVKKAKEEVNVEMRLKEKGFEPFSASRKEEARPEKKTRGLMARLRPMMAEGE